MTENDSSEKTIYEWSGLYYCPKCGKKKLHQHSQWSTGDVSEVPFCYCTGCKSEFYMSETDSYFSPTRGNFPAEMYPDEQKPKPIFDAN